MTRTKKVLGLLLALAMVFGCMTMAFATDPGADARAASITVATTANELAAGESATITVSATTNFTASTWSVPVFYNKTLVSIAVTSVGGTAIATDADAVDSSLVYANTGYDAATYGFVLVQFTAENGETIADTLNSKEIVSFTVTAKADVEGDAAVVVPATALKTTSNANGKLYFGCSTEGTTVSGVAELVSNIDTTAATQTITIGSAGPNTLVLKDEYADSGIIVDLEIAGIIASEDWYAHLIGAEDATATGMIYGLDTVGYDDLFESESYTQLEDAFTTAYGDEYLEIITPEAAEGYETTGTIVNVLDKESAVVETYYFIYFGDVNSDGYVDANDAAEVKQFDFTQDSIITVAATIAADYNGDSYMDANDGADLTYVDFYQEGYPAQADLAAAFYAAAYGL